MPKLISSILLLATAGIACLAPSAQAALTISTTRIVQQSDKNSSVLVVANPSKRTYAAQVWVNTEADDVTTPVALIPSPALFHLAPEAEQTVQINRLPNDLPQDRESLFFFNLQEIPQVEAEHKNSLTIALRTRIKLFYRPSGLKSTPQEGIERLSWSVSRVDGKAYLTVTNPTPFYYTFNQLELSGAGLHEQIETKAMAIPMAEQHYAIPTSVRAGKLQVTFDTINDYGGRTAEITQPVVDLAQ